MSRKNKDRPVPEKKTPEVPNMPIPEIPTFANEVFFPYYTEQMSYDPLGSYTGVPAEPDTKPVQDADDL